MNNFVIEFEHPNKAGAKITILAAQIFGVMDLPENQCVAIVGPGSALVPVRGTHAEVLHKITKSLEAARASSPSLKQKKGKKKNGE